MQCDLCSISRPPVGLLIGLYFHIYPSWWIWVRRIAPHTRSRTKKYLPPLSQDACTFTPATVSSSFFSIAQTLRRTCHELFSLRSPPESCRTSALTQGGGEDTLRQSRSSAKLRWCDAFEITLSGSSHKVFTRRIDHR